MCAWTFRPSALSSSYNSISVSSLLRHYLDDGSQAAEGEMHNRPVISPLRKEHQNFTSESETAEQVQHLVPFRMCQWNIHHLKPIDKSTLGYKAAKKDDETPFDHAHRVADEILATDADAVVLNEFGVYGRKNVSKALHELCRRLEEAGYVIYESRCIFPTAIATRLPVVESGSLDLDGCRGAVYVKVAFQQRRGVVDKEEKETETVDKDGSTGEVASGEKAAYVTLYGTHLDDNDERSSIRRLTEARSLLSMIDLRPDDRNVLIIGDFNQQRQCDYTEKEWEAICQNKARRDSPKDDSVSTMLQEAGFQCCYDSLKRGGRHRVNCNWNEYDPPPATHWTSTVVDYSYSRGDVQITGVYVSPSSLSDHRMVVCDWSVVCE